MENGKVTTKNEKLVLGAIRATVIDTINKAKSGHPGMALDAAPLMVALFRDHLIANPSDPNWFNRDRLVFSSGHASTLLYTMLHLSGYGLTIDDLKNFRQLGAKTPGHPEYGWTPGVDATGGPLGQGISQAVGMAMAEAHLRAAYPEGNILTDHYTYCLCGDGSLEEGISYEAASLAGHHGLNRLILFYDQNGATLDGPTSDALSEDVAKRFEAAKWNVIEVKDGEDVEALSRAISKAKEEKSRPTCIIFKETIGIGSKNQGTSKTHGAPLGEEDGAYAKASYGYDHPPFEIPEEVYAFFQATFAKRGKAAHEAYLEASKAYEKKYPQEYALFIAGKNRDLSSVLANIQYPQYESGYNKASRVSSGEILKAVTSAIPFTMGGSADVAGSTNTNVPGMERFTSENPAGRDMRFGVREFAMAGAANGMALHGGVLPYVSSFFVFSDYMKPAIRMASLENLPVIYLFTHDSLAVGEDGPTHQPIEQLAMLRAQPNVNVIRPADAKEVIAAYQMALESKTTPTAIVLTRQGLPLLEGSDVEKAKKGAYCVYEAKEANIEILATGSEVSLAVAVAKCLEEHNLFARVISMPCLEKFEQQEASYQEEILNLPRCKRVSLEMATTFGWGAYARHNIGVDTFGKSAKAADVLADFGFTEDAITEKILKIFAK